MIPGAYKIPGSNFIVLTNIPKVPSDFLNVTAPFSLNPGISVTASPDYWAKNIPLTPKLSYQITSKDDIILSFLSIFLIAICIDIIYTILLRSSRSHTMIAANVVSAAMVEEVTHIRNIWAYWSKLKGKLRPVGRRTAVTSLVALITATFMLGMEVIVVFITQQIVFFSTRHAYNIRGIHPAGTSRNISSSIRKIAVNRECVTSIWANERQRRTFHVRTCQNYAELLSVNVTGGDILVGSWYTRYGSYHEISWKENVITMSLWSEIVSRTQDAEMEEPLRILFDVRENANYEASRYKHQRIIYGAIEWACNINDISLRWQRCEEILRGLKEKGWEKKSMSMEQIFGKMGKSEEIEGVVSKFFVKDLGDQMFDALRRNFQTELIASGAIEEVEGLQKYADPDGLIVDGKEGLLTDIGRVSGVWMMIVLVCIGSLVLVFLRWWLKPISLSFLASQNVLEFSFEQTFEHQSNNNNHSLSYAGNKTEEEPTSSSSLQSEQFYTHFGEGNSGNIQV